MTTECQNCGELVAKPDSHWISAERVGEWWTCASVEDTAQRIRRLRVSIQNDTELLKLLCNRRAQKARSDA